MALGPAVPIHVPQDHVLPVYGCGTGCRVETEQISLPEVMDDGWIRLNVIQKTWINQCDWDNSDLETRHCWDEPASGRGEPPVQRLWLFADCPGGRFATSWNSDRSDSREQHVFHEDGKWKGDPKFQTVYGNPFMRWAKLCPKEAEEGMQYIDQFFQRFSDILDQLNPKRP